MAYTQGPWSLDDVTCDSYGENDVIGFWVRGYPGNKSLDGMVVASVVSDCLEENVESNARLIAAAPELLEALELCFAMAKIFHRDTDDVWAAAKVKIEHAIAKAKGLNPDQG